MKLLWSCLAGFLLSGCVIAATGMPRPTGRAPSCCVPDDDPFDDPSPPPKPAAPAAPRPRPAIWGLVAPGVAYDAAAFTDFNTGWVVGGVDPVTRKAAIRHTRNAGATWTVQDRGINGLRAVFFVNPNVGFAGGDNGVLFRTVDGGSTWKLLDGGTSEPIIGISFLNLMDGLFLTRNAGIFHTTDGGATWTRRNIIPEARDLDYRPNGAAYVVATSGLFRFQSGVLTKLDFPADRPGTFTFVDPAQRLGWAVGTAGNLFRTDDAGATWEEVRRLTTPDQYVTRVGASAIAFSTPSDGMLLADRTAYTTSDGGDTWDRTDARLNFARCGKYFRLFDASHGWAFGDGQTLYRLGH